MIEGFERKWMELKNAKKKQAASWNFEMGRFEDNIVIVDSKFYDGHPSKEEKDAARARLNQLASVLQNLHRLEDGIPECLCWMNRLDKGAYSLLFKIPADLEPQPQSLYDALPDTPLSSGPLLDERLEMAYRLASALDSLHSVSWIHKSIRSENILFFYTKILRHDSGRNIHRQDVTSEVVPLWLRVCSDDGRRDVEQVGYGSCPQYLPSPAAMGCSDHNIRPNARHLRSRRCSARTRHLAQGNVCG